MRKFHISSARYILGNACLCALLIIITTGCASSARQLPEPTETNGIPWAGLAKLPAGLQAQFVDPEWQAAPGHPIEGSSFTGWEPEAELKELSRNTPWINGAAELAAELPEINGLRIGSAKTTSALAAKGEYADIAPDAVPPFGCNNDPSNSANGHAIEDVIAAAPDPVDGAYLGTVERYSAEPNYFTPTGGSGNDVFSEVCQLYSNSLSEPTQFGELGYRADLAPGVGPNGDCGTAIAYSIGGRIWRRFTTSYNVLPALGMTELMNVFIAPRSAESDPITAPVTTTVASYQQFYCGALPENYGGAWIIALLGTNSPFTDFKDWLEQSIAQDNGRFFTYPIYGVLLKRWQDAMSPAMAGPWETSLGWPVFGPIAYRNGSATATMNGVYYAWGMYFERGLIWWVDYDQELYPNTPDMGQLYYYTGTNVWEAPSGEYVRAGPPILYNHAGPLGVCVQVDAPLNTHQSSYLAELVDSGNGPEATLSMHAHGYGGQADAQWRYKYYVWGFGDDLYQPDPTAFVDDTKWLTHTYTVPGIYTVRVEITDAVDGTSFGYSLPIHVTDDTPG